MIEREVTILGLVVDERATHAPEVQEVITRYGAQILSRSGVPAPSKNRGIITLTMEASEQERTEMEHDLQQISGVQVRTMHFGIPADNFANQ
jgi:putative iron-only hydrogenase system regulator